MNTNRKAEQQNRKAEKREKASRKDNRVPLGQHRRKLALDPEFKEKIESQGYVTRYINDQGSRIHEAKQAGYRFVTNDGAVQIGEGEDQNTDPGSRISLVVDTDDANNPIRAYLMAIPREFYEEDQTEKQKQVDEIDNAIKGGKVAPGEKQYIPEGGISYRP